MNYETVPVTLIDLDTASMVHKAINNVAPSYLSKLFHKRKTVHNHNTRGSAHGLFPKHSNLKFGQRSFASYGCKVWNSLKFVSKVLSSTL